ncbi:permease [Melghirimyces profundicolus]|nr:permease [Melghirimyces profundicolus]
MARWIRNWSAEIGGFAVLLLFFWLIQGGIETLYGLKFPSLTVSVEVETVTTLFLSIFIEGIPFILMGVLVSGLIQVYVREELIWRLVPKKRILSIPMASLLGLLLPVCECGIVPVTRRLIQKGLPPHTAFTFLLSAPVVNPITIVSTYIAFGFDWGITLSRLALAGIIACTMGWVFSWFLKGSPLRPDGKEDENHPCQEPACNHHAHSRRHREDRLGHALYHAVFEFMDMGKYFVAGAMVAALFQTVIGLSAIRDFAQNEWITVLLMMGLAFGLSLCSSADAFVAASFRNALPTTSLLAFLVFGPMMDLKNLFMMVGSFRLRVIGIFFGGTSLLTLTAIIAWKAFQ